MDIEWLLSTLFDASLLSPRAAGNGGSFFCAISGQASQNRAFPARLSLPGNYVSNFAWTEKARAAMLTQSLRGRARQ
jgi:hypothetical protein